MLLSKEVSEHRLERAALPRGHFRVDGIGDGANDIPRYLHGYVSEEGLILAARAVAVIRRVRRLLPAGRRAQMVRQLAAEHPLHEDVFLKRFVTASTSACDIGRGWRSARGLPQECRSGLGCRVRRIDTPQV